MDYAKDRRRMNVAGYIVAVFLIAAVMVWVFTDWQKIRNVDELTFSEKMDAIEAAELEAARYRRNRK